MEKQNKSYDSTTLTIDLKEMKCPLQEMASNMDTSIGWLVRKMIKEHPSMEHIKEKGARMQPIK